MPSLTLTLILMRHGHAEDGAKGKDHARRLTRKGEAEARTTARRLVRAGWRPGLVLTSDAARTHGTWAVVEDVLRQMAVGPLPAVQSRQDLYLGSSDATLAALAGVAGATAAPLLLVGHNPTISDVVTLLSADYAGLGTGEAAVLTADAASWADAVQLTGAWTLQAVVCPDAADSSFDSEDPL